MNENFEEYRDLVQLMQTAPKRNVSEGFTETVMNRLAEPKVDFWALLKRAMRGSGEVTVAGFGRECAAGQESCFHFLIAGLFFFFIGVTLFATLFYSPSINGFVLAHAILLLTTAISLAVAGLMLAARVPAAAHWAKRAIMVYGFLIMANAFVLQAAVKTSLGGIFALAFGLTGILMGMVLMKALKSETGERTARKERIRNDYI